MISLVVLYFLFVQSTEWPTYHLDNHHIKIMLKDDWSYQKQNDSTYLFQTDCESSSSCTEMKFQIAHAKDELTHEQFELVFIPGFTAERERYIVHSMGMEYIHGLVFHTAFITYWDDEKPILKTFLLRQRGNEIYHILPGNLFVG